MSDYTALIADDSVLLREGLVSILERVGFHIVAEEADAPSVEQRIDDFASSNQLPDILIVDVRMPPSMRTDGLEIACTLKRRYPRLSIMVLSQYLAPVYAHELFSIPHRLGDGGTGYLLKERVADIADFVSSIRLVISGGVVVDPEVSQAMIRQGSHELSKLSGREREVLALMAQGLDNQQIAQRLIISQAAVAKHVSNIFLKLNLTPNDTNRRVRAILTYLSNSFTLSSDRQVLGL